MAFDLREIAVQSLVKDAVVGQAVADHVVQSSSMIDEPRTLFVVLKLGVDAELNGWRGGPRERVEELWVHDQPGDYGTIDSLIEEIKRVRASLPSKTLLPDLDQSKLVEVQYLGVTQDLEDPELGTIFRVARFQWTTSS
jgi:hypothetical protein